jgi:hypothetical protein
MDLIKFVDVFPCFQLLNSHCLCQCPEVFSYTNFNVLHLTLRSLIHFELTSLQDERQGSNFSHVHEDIHFSRTIFVKKLSFLQCLLLAPLWKSGICSWKALFLGCQLHSIGLPVYLYKEHTAFNTRAL